MNVTGHDADLDFLRGDQTWAVGAQQQSSLAASRFFGAHSIAHFKHVTHWNAFGDADGQVEVGFDGFPDGCSCAGGRHINDRHRSACVGSSLFDRGVNGDVEDGFARFFGVHTCNETVFTVGVLLAFFSMELTGLAGNTLGNDFGVFVDKDRHVINLSPL